MKVIGHRGAAGLAPENTWASFDAAVSLGVDAFETDVRATSDGELVLMHDERLDRTTDGEGLLHATPWSTVRTLDGGSWFSERFRGTSVPRLRETLERYGPLTHLVLEIKQPGIELEVSEAVRGLGLMDRVTFTSYDFSAVRRIKTTFPPAEVGFLTSDLDWGSIRRTTEARLDQFCPPASFITRGMVSRWKSLGLEVRAWGVKDFGLMMRAVRAKVDGMTVDFPHLLLDLLGRPSSPSEDGARRDP